MDFLCQPLLDKQPLVHRCSVFGVGVPVPDIDDVVRIGTGGAFLEILPDGTARIIGAYGDEAVDAVLNGIAVALALNPYGIHYGKLGCPTEAPA